MAINNELIVAKLGLDTTITASGTEYICSGDQPHGQIWWACVDRVKYQPTKIGEFGGIGYFGEVELYCTDFALPSGGTYFGRLIANNPYYLNRTIEIWQGNYNRGESFSFANLTKRTYFLKRIMGPDEKNRVVLYASDAASILSESLIPKAENSVLDSSLTAGATQLYCDDPDAHTAISSVYYFIINDELISATTKEVDGFSGLTRGIGGTTAAAHDAADEIRSIYYYSGNCVDAARFAIENFSDFDHASYLPDADWNTERDTYLNGQNVEIWQTEPIKVGELINSIGESTYTAYWWEDSAQEFRVKALGPDLSSPSTINDADDILANAPLKIVRDQRKLLTQIWVHYGKIDKSGSNDAKNYSEHLLRVNATVAAGLGTDLTKIIYAEYLPAGGSGTASIIASRIMDQATEPTEIKLRLDSRMTAFSVGDFVDLYTDKIQDASGTTVTKRMRIIASTPLPNNQYELVMVHSGLDISLKYGLIQESYTLAAQLTSATTTSVQVNTTIPATVNPTGTIYVINDAGTSIACTYTSFSTDTFTINSTDFSLPNAAAGNIVMIDYLNRSGGYQFQYAFIADSADDKMSDDSSPTVLL